MTGAYIRVLREGKWQNVEVEHLTKEERAEAFGHKTTDELVRWLNLLCETLTDVTGEDDVNTST